MKFEAYRLAEQLKKNLEIANFKRPTDIQYKTIPHVIDGEDVLAIAQTGTGKTAAFVIPILDILIQNKKKQDGIRCLVMAPTHELAKQINGVFNALAKNTGITSTVIIGGVDQEPQIKKLKEGVDVLVATPGRIFDLVNQEHLHLWKAEILVIDEADQMLDLGFYKDIMDLIKYLPKKRQTLYFSATISPKIKKLAYSLVNNPIRIQISPKNPVSKNVTHHVAHIEMDDKRFFLERMVNENPESKILVFVRTKVRAERVLKAMQRVNITSVTIHSDKVQTERDEAMNAFRTGEVKMLVATDVSARGIDIPNVDFVVNYDLPDKDENYVHRVGRTGRGNQKGNAVSFCSTEEKELLADIEKYIGGSIDELEISKSDYVETIDFTNEHNDNWQMLLKDEAESVSIRKKKKKKKR
ncbi:MAG: DEAD/DEAH box helicase [Prolixibacteraceae bacterium]|jgi:ATP-dependent RNA helicase RhlE|nr:DEAD/DEAH box helicase [Prolixibacteraceae bacterium]